MERTGNNDRKRAVYYRLACNEKSIKSDTDFNIPKAEASGVTWIYFAKNGKQIYPINCM